jgi:hypothetical protein
MLVGASLAGGLLFLLMRDRGFEDSLVKAIFEAYLGLVRAHFVINAGI